MFTWKMAVKMQRERDRPNSRGRGTAKI